MANLRWRPTLEHYKTNKFIALRFGNKDDFRAAIRVAMKDPEFPFDLVGHHVLIVPKDAIPFFKGIPFTEEGVREASDIPPDKLNKLRREQGGF